MRVNFTPTNFSDIAKREKPSKKGSEQAEQDCNEKIQQAIDEILAVQEKSAKDIMKKYTKPKK